jgi:multisubunit Na+/H+ antiporter MnhE subunit
MNWNLLLFVFLGCAFMVLGQWIKKGREFNITLMLGKVVFGFIAGTALCYFIDQFSIQAAAITLATMGIIYATYVLPGIKNL